jgi:hypothetical protein
MSRERETAQRRGCGVKRDSPKGRYVMNDVLKFRNRETRRGGETTDDTETFERQPTGEAESDPGDRAPGSGAFDMFSETPSDPLFDRASGTPAGENAPGAREREKSRAELFLEAGIDKLLSEMDTTAVASDGTVKPVDATFDVQISKDRLKAFVDLYPASGGGKALEYAAICDHLLEMGIKEIAEESLSEGVHLCNSTGEIQRRVVAAEGIPPKFPREARLEIFFPLEGRKPPHMEHTEAKVDYRDRGEIFSVKTGELLAILEPAVPGEPGQDVFGNVIEVPDLPKAPVIMGDGVASDDGRIFTATTTGQPMFRGNRLLVKPVVVVQGDVDLRVGNVLFDGSIIVRGNVREGFLVSAGVDVEVFGNVESAFIKAGRNVHIHGGILGETSEIDAGGKVTMRFMEGGIVAADEEVVAMSHLMHARVHSGKSVLLEGRRGSDKGVLGGSVVALERIDVVAAGTPMGTRTLLATGIDFRTRARIEALEVRIRELQEMAAKISEVIKRSITRFVKDSHIALPPDIQTKMELLLQHYNASIRELHYLQDERTALRNSMEQKTRGGGYIKVKQKLHPGVVVEIRGVRREIKDELRFVSFRFDSDTGSIAMGSYR